MGAIEARGMDDLEWFIDQLGADSWQYGIQDWDGIRRCVMKVLWMDSIFEGLDDHLPCKSLNPAMNSVQCCERHAKSPASISTMVACTVPVL
jgi:hypothetical protein